MSACVLGSKQAESACNVIHIKIGKLGRQHSIEIRGRVIGRVPHLQLFAQDRCSRSTSRRKLRGSPASVRREKRVDIGHAVSNQPSELDPPWSSPRVSPVLQCRTRHLETSREADLVDQVARLPGDEADVVVVDRVHRGTSSLAFTSDFQLMLLGSRSDVSDACHQGLSWGGTRVSGGRRWMSARGRTLCCSYVARNAPNIY